MIQLRQFPVDGTWYLYFNYSVVGPFTSTGQQTYAEVEYRHRRDYIAQLAQYMGENDVSHRQVDADLICTPTNASIIPNATTIGCTFAHKSGSSRVIKSVSRGHFIDKQVKIVRELSGRTEHFAATQIGSTWKFYSVSTSPVLAKMKTHLSSWTCATITFSVAENGVVSVNRTYKTCSVSGGMPLGQDWTLDHTLEEIIGLEPLVSPYQTSGTLPAWEKWVPFDTSISTAASASVAIDIFCEEAIKSKSPDFNYGTLSQEAVTSFVGNDMNTLEFLRDLRHPERLLPKLKNFLSLPKDVNVLKKYSSEYLRAHYGIMPTISDVKSIWSAFNKNRPYFDKHGFYSVHAGQSVSSIQPYGLRQDIFRSKIAIAKEVSSYVRALHTFDQMGTLPNVDNIWELIPYSFIIDWMAPVSELLEAVTARQRLARYDIRYTTLSHKEIHTKVFGESEAVISGSATVVIYHRWTLDQCPLPPLSPQPDTSGSSHWLEATALIIQRF